MKHRQSMEERLRQAALRAQKFHVERFRTRHKRARKPAPLSLPFTKDEHGNLSRRVGLDRSVG
jgi:hypothetical protein